MLKPLPLKGGALFIDNSTLEDLQACPRKMEYRFLEKRVPVRDKPALNAGGCVHHVLRYRYRMAPQKPSARDCQMMERCVDAYFKARPQPEDDFRQAGYIKKVIEKYTEKYFQEEFQVLQTDRGPFVEFPFAYKLFDVHYEDGSLLGAPIPVYYTGRADLGVVIHNDLWGFDTKTTSMMGSSFSDEQAMSAQQRGYCWAMRKATGKCPKGYIINGIRMRPPAKTRSLVIDEDFERPRFYVSDEILDEWERNVKELILEFFHHYERGYMPTKSIWCCGKYGKCQYFDCCSLPPQQRATYLTSPEFEENKWSPLNNH